MYCDRVINAHASRTAFTLVELSIVLVILGLLIGGVLTGQSLIRAAELRSITTQYTRYVAAVHTFRDKYFALPGDMTNATSYWGIAAGTGSDAACKAFASTSAATCNGDGNGLVAASTGSAEHYRFWQHLANAGLIEGNYNGADGPGTTLANAPAGKLSGSIWHAAYVTFSGNASYFDYNYGNHLEFGGISPGMQPGVPILKPEDAYNIDMKMDDGMPAMGKVMVRDTSGFSGANCTTATSSAMLTATYNLSQKYLNCMFMFPNAF